MENETLTLEEREFCQLYINGRSPFAGNAYKCYVEVFKPKETDKWARHRAMKLLGKKHIKEYIKQLCGYQTEEEETDEIRRFISSNLRKIMEEASDAVYFDHRGNLLSPSAMRSVAVAAGKALLDMYPLRVSRTQAKKQDDIESKGVTLNVVVPEKRSNDE